jgi:hypothetical protein
MRNTLIIFSIIILISCQTNKNSTKYIFPKDEEIECDIKEFKVLNNEIYNVINKLNDKFNNCYKVKNDKPLYISLKLKEIDGVINLSIVVLDFFYSDKYDYEFRPPNFIGGFYYKNDLIIISHDSDLKLVDSFFYDEGKTFVGKFKFGIGGLFASLVVKENNGYMFREEICGF